MHTMAVLQIDSGFINKIVIYIYILFLILIYSLLFINFLHNFSWVRACVCVSKCLFASVFLLSSQKFCSSVFLSLLFLVHSMFHILVCAFAPVICSTQFSCAFSVCSHISRTCFRVPYSFLHILHSLSLSGNQCLFAFVSEPNQNLANISS